MLELLMATQNAGKIRELTNLLADAPIIVKSLNNFGKIAEPAETGATFAANAALKAAYYAQQTGITALADDSGIEVAALGGAPGIFSARYAGEKATDAERIAKLLFEIAQTGDEKRQARFVCAMALSDAQGAILASAEGICTGRLAPTPRGENGFGYDPIFIPDGFLETFGELSGEIKQEISHRALATAKIVGFLRGFVVV